METDTIVALASAPGRSAIASIRLSGKDTFKILAAVVPAKAIEKLQPRQATVVDVHSFRANGAGGDGAFIDRCVLVPFVAPHSYTGEDVAEITCHGGHLVYRLILEALTAAGARLARPGEFTYRAFLNDKMDLAQAESIESIVSATSQAALALAHHQYSGQFSRDIRELRDRLIDLLSLLELELDFAEEDVEFADRSDLHSRLAAVEELLQKLRRSYDRSHLVREGLSVAIVGKPNVGKSSLLNLLLKKERAIVTDIPGTTRDVIEEALEIGGIKFVFSDTAGIRAATDLVEQEGIRRSESALQRAAILLLLVDNSRHLQKEDWEIRQVVLREAAASKKQVLLIRNKVDLPAASPKDEMVSFARGMRSVELSCTTGANLAELEQALLAFAGNLIGDLDESETMLISVRQRDIVDKALASVREAQTHFEQNLSQEFISSELRIGLDYLGELIGEVTTEDILGNIFSNFCIGK